MEELRQAFIIKFKLEIPKNSSLIVTKSNGQEEKDSDEEVEKTAIETDSDLNDYVEIGEKSDAKFIFFGASIVENPKLVCQKEKIG